MLPSQPWKTLTQGMFESRCAGGNCGLTVLQEAEPADTHLATCNNPTARLPKSSNYQTGLAAFLPPIAAPPQSQAAHQQNVREGGRYQPAALTSSTGIKPSVTMAQKSF